MKAYYKVEKDDLDIRFGAVDIDTLAASIYNSFHGECECSSHPFVYEENGEFKGNTPWEPGKPEKGDRVVAAFRLAALAAYEALKATGIGSLQ